MAKGHIVVSDEVLDAILNHKNKKGDVLTVAQIAGINGAKRTSELIPLCHNVPISSCKLNFEIDGNKIYATSTLKTTYKTGIEMEALTSVSIALLTIYDMCKAIDKKMEIKDVKLIKKTGGKSDILN